MEKHISNPLKRENRKSSKPAQSKKKKCEGLTCSTFFSDLTRKFKIKKKSKEDTNNIAKSIIESITESLLSEVCAKTLVKIHSPLEETPNKTEETTSREHLADVARLIGNDTFKPQLAEITTRKDISSSIQTNKFEPTGKLNKIINNSLQIETNVKNVQTSKTLVKINLRDKQPSNVAMKECDIAGELTKHVATLRKISLIADEFNKKTAKNLKEIVDSVSEDLVKKLEEVKAEKAQSPTPENKIAINLGIE